MWDTLYNRGCQAGVCCGPCNPSKWEADFWGWLEVRRSAILHYTVNQRPNWACLQYGNTGETDISVDSLDIEGSGHRQATDDINETRLAILCHKMLLLYFGGQIPARQIRWRFWRHNRDVQNKMFLTFKRLFLYRLPPRKWYWLVQWWLWLDQWTIWQPMFNCCC
jgi:hypothetical protein